MEIEFVKLMGAIIGASGIWKALEWLVKWRFEKRVKQAEANNLNAQAENQIIENWITWSQHLEDRVKGLEAVAEENRKLTQMVNSQQNMIETQRAKISELEGKVRSLEKENAALKKELTKLSNHGK